MKKLLTMTMMMVVVALLCFSLLLVVVITVDYCMCVFGICQSDVGVRMIVSHNRSHVSHRHVIISHTHTSHPLLQIQPIKHVFHKLQEPTISWGGG